MNEDAIMPTYRIYRVYYLKTGVSVLPMDNHSPNQSELSRMARMMHEDDDTRNISVDYFVREER